MKKRESEERMESSLVIRDWEEDIHAVRDGDILEISQAHPLDPEEPRPVRLTASEFSEIAAYFRTASPNTPALELPGCFGLNVERDKFHCIHLTADIYPGEPVFRISFGERFLPDICARLHFISERVRCGTARGLKLHLECGGVMELAVEDGEIIFSRREKLADKIPSIFHLPVEDLPKLMTWLDGVASDVASDDGRFVIEALRISHARTWFAEEWAFRMPGNDSPGAEKFPSPDAIVLEGEIDPLGDILLSERIEPGGVISQVRIEGASARGVQAELSRERHPIPHEMKIPCGRTRELVISHSKVSPYWTTLSVPADHGNPVPSVFRYQVEWTRTVAECIQGLVAQLPNGGKV